MNDTAVEKAAENGVNTALTTITGVLSLFGTLFIVVSFFVWKDIQTTSRKILVFISIADFFTAIGTIMGLWSDNKLVCLLQSTIGTLSVLCSFFWTVFMALYLYIAVSKKNLRSAGTLMFLFHAFGWGIPIVIVFVAASTGKLGNNGDMVSSGWCWVNIDLSWKEQVLWMLLAGKGWEIVAYFAIALLYFLIKRHMKKELNQEDRLLTQSTAVQAQRAERKLIFVPLLFVLLRIWGTIRFFIMVANGPNHKPTAHTWLIILQGIGDTAPGFANFLLFCFFTEKVLGQLQLWCRPCVKRNPLKSKSPYIHRPGSNMPSYCVETTQDPTVDCNKQVVTNETEDSPQAHTNVTVQ